ncbi:MAG: hypothetical protein JNM14_11420 [Ferruginibacter sp.]|nr:hypothetical protein [Ferruginibacter sp.]
MKKYYLLCMMLFAACINSGLAQTVSSQKGLTTAVFNLPAGIIKVYLPDDIRPGDMISGSVTAVPSGKNAKQTAKNLVELKKYTVEFNGQKIPVEAKSFQCNIDERILPLRTLNLMNGNGENAGLVNIQSTDNRQIQTAPAECKIPTHALTAAPLRITGPFDGNSSNTNCIINNIPCELYTESPRQCLVAFPQNAKGNQTIEVQENSQPKCLKKISGVDLNVSAGKTNLMKGDKTYLNVEVTGLQNLPDTAKLTITNITTDVVVMQPVNNFVVLLTPDNVNKGTYTRRFDVQSIKTGNFTVNVNIDLPENNPPVFADVRAPKGGKRDEKVLTAGTRTAFNIAMKKWADANTEGKNPIDFQCENCVQCIKAYATEKNAGDVGELGWGIITSFLSGSLKMAGGVLEKVKDVADKGGDIYKAIKHLIDKGKIQVIGFKEKWCENNQYCQVTGIIVYDVATGCAKAEYRCRGTKMCCPFAETTYIMNYCFDEDGAVIDETISIDIMH